MWGLFYNKPHDIRKKGIYMKHIAIIINNTKPKAFDLFDKLINCIEKYNFDENILKNIEVENDVKELSKKISGV